MYRGAIIPGLQMEDK